MWNLAFIFAIMGFIFTTRTWLKTLDKLNPIYGLIIYYIIITSFVILLEYFGLVISGIKYSTSWQTIGTILIIFSFFIVVSWESCYVNTITKGNCDDVSNVYLQSEDGAVYYFWSYFTDNLSARRILTYVVTPFILTIIGQSLITQKVTLL